MEDIQQLLVQAADHLSSGSVKDAYFSYIGVLDIVSKELRSIKIVNNVVTSKPPSISLFVTARTCLSYAEEIVTKHAPPTPTLRKNPNLNIAIYPPTPSQEEHPIDASGPSRAPPVPPKPARRSTPTPTRVSAEGLIDSNASSPRRSASPRRYEHRSASPRLNERGPVSPQAKPPLPPKPVRTGSFKKFEQEITRQNTRTGSGEDDEVEIDSSDSDYDDDGDQTVRSDDNLVVTSSTLLRRRSSSPNLSVNTMRRRSATTGSMTDSPTDEESPYTPRSSSPVTPRSWYHLSLSSLIDQNRQKLVTVTREGVVDPKNLVPATTPAELDDSQNPGSPLSTICGDHVPTIPASPLLSLHNRMEQKIRTLEEKLTEYRALQRSTDGDEKAEAVNDVTGEEIKEKIREYSANIASLKQAITRSRRLVYKAATDPDVLQFAPHLLAYQLTLVEFALFQEIEPMALLTHSPKNPDQSITASTDFFNYLTRLVERSVLLPPEASTRAQIIHHWVKVSVKLHELQNFQTLKALLAALGTPPIKRLKRTWACIPKKSMTKLEALNELMSESRNYGKYREHVQQQIFFRRPTIPFLGTFIMDATYLLAAVKSSYANHASSTPGSAQSTPGSPPPSNPAQDDPRVQDLLQTLQRYRTGPKYDYSLPPAYVKASTKHYYHHFRATSISAALHRSGYKPHRNDDDEETIEEKQQLITHYLLTRTWIPEKNVDELSLQREPQKHKNSIGGGSTASQRTSGGRGSTATSGVWNGGSVASNARESMDGSGTSTGGNVSASSGMGRASSTSGSGDSRPNSVGEGVDTEPVHASGIVERAVPITDKDTGVSKEKERRNITEKVGSFLFGSRTSLDGGRDEKAKSIADASSLASATKRTSWRTSAVRQIFGGSDSTESQKGPSPPTKPSTAPHSRSPSISDPPPPKTVTSTFLKQHARTSSANAPLVKPPLPVRRSLDEPRLTTPPPLLPKPAALMQRSASANGVASGGSCSSPSGGPASATGASGSVGLCTAGSNSEEDLRMALARKVASEVAAGSMIAERKRR